MNNIQFEISKKELKNKIEVRILANGTEIGKRTSSRLYRFALAVKGNQARALEQAKQNLNYQRKLAATYQAVVNNEPGAHEKFINFNSNGTRCQPFAKDLHRQWLTDGTVQGWLNNSVVSIKKLEEYVARLSSGPQPEFDVIRIASWHQARKNVPTCAAHQVFVAVVEIPE